MKKIITSIFLIILTIQAINAQFTKIGGGIGYGTGYWFHKMEYDYNRSGHFAGFLEGVYEITVPIHVTGSFSYFIPHVTKYDLSKTTVSSMMFDINGHYVINSLDRFEFYPLVGMDVLFTWKKDKYTSGTMEEVFKEKDNAIGLNVGAGTYIKVTDQFDVFGEAKYIVSKYGQFMINAGVYINLDWLKKHENE